jgi:hypothetical protein
MVRWGNAAWTGTGRIRRAGGAERTWTTLLMKKIAGPAVPDEVVGGGAGEVVAERTSLRIFVFCLSVISLYSVN